MANPRVEEIIDEPDNNAKADDAESSSGSEVEGAEGTLFLAQACMQHSFDVFNRRMGVQLRDRGSLVVYRLASTTA